MKYLYNLYTTICRFFFWGWKLRNNYDWDFDYLYKIQSLKLRRMYDYMTKHGVTVSSNKNSRLMKLLLEASVLAERISGGLYYNDYFDKNNLTRFKCRDKLEKEQTERFHYIIRRYSKFWWD